ncbi:hypothetical protein DQ04_00091250 [Trypanosoma grayi]|uniref:hypothetical protein n=1 Tax=Trypanosoma grayi TaxID=71804 RepID=UPI0004F468C2|nr:hypothetical protein DQ04_00091250 [Trypanosoma grayi]KEG15391.1 hypothetical protein DQ04_00091250 [Trypanosoma grayi]
MGLLLDDEEDYMRPLKSTRIEGHSTPAVQAAAASEVAAGPNSNNHDNNDTSKSEKRSSLEIPLCGGNGLAKMDVFAFGVGRAMVKVIDTPSARGQRRSSILTSQESPRSSGRRSSQPPTVAKTIFNPSQVLSETTETTASRETSSRPVDLSLASSSAAVEPSTSSSLSTNSVSRQLFGEGGATNAGATSAVAPAVEGSEALPKPKGQMKLSDFFTKMACTRKKE